MKFLNKKFRIVKLSFYFQSIQHGCIMVTLLTTNSCRVLLNQKIIQSRCYTVDQQCDQNIEFKLYLIGQQKQFVEYYFHLEEIIKKVERSRLLQNSEHEVKFKRGDENTCFILVNFTLVWQDIENHKEKRIDWEKQEKEVEDISKKYFNMMVQNAILSYVKQRQEQLKLNQHYCEKPKFSKSKIESMKKIQKKDHVKLSAPFKSNHTCKASGFKTYRKANTQQQTSYLSKSLKIKQKCKKVESWSPKINIQINRVRQKIINNQKIHLRQPNPLHRNKLSSRYCKSQLDQNFIEGKFQKCNLTKNAQKTKFYAHFSNLVEPLKSLRLKNRSPFNDQKKEWKEKLQQKFVKIQNKSTNSKKLSKVLQKIWQKQLFSERLNHQSSLKQINNQKLTQRSYFSGYEEVVEVQINKLLSENKADLGFTSSTQQSQQMKKQSHRKIWRKNTKNKLKPNIEEM